jgi:RNA polymerase sigma factor (sigma-70 family)
MQPMNNRNDQFILYETEVRGAVACAIKSVLNRLPSTSLDAEELFSEGLVFAYGRMGHYDPTRSQVITYLYRAIRKKVHRFAMKEIRSSGVVTMPTDLNSERPGYLLEDMTVAPNHYNVFTDAENSIENSYKPDYDLSFDVREALKAFGDKDRQIIIDKFIHNSSIDDIADKYGMTRCSADRYVKELRMTMKRRLKKYDHTQIY